MRYTSRFCSSQPIFRGGAAWAYEETTVSDGGTLLGTVKLEGQDAKT